MRGRSSTHWGIILSVFALGVALAGPAAAAGPQFPPQIPLSQAQVESVVATLGPVEALGKKYDTDDNASYDSNADVGSQIKRALQNTGALAEFNGIVTQHGFQGFDDWWQTAFSVICAASPEQFNVSDADLAAGVANIQSNTMMTDAQKAQTIAAMQQGAATMAQMSPLPQNVAIVAPYAAQVKALTNDE